MFSGPIDTRWNADGVTMVVLTAVTFTDRRGRVWPVRAGFNTNGASIPTPLWGLIGSPYTGMYRPAAVFHDQAYDTLGCPKREADAMLLEAMLELGCSSLRARLIYDGVHFGGLSAYTAAQAVAAARGRLTP